MTTNTKLTKISHHHGPINTDHTVNFTFEGDHPKVVLTLDIPRNSTPAKTAALITAFVSKVSAVV